MWYQIAVTNIRDRHVNWDAALRQMILLWCAVIVVRFIRIHGRLRYRVSAVIAAKVMITPWADKVN
jgi:hypothetical protein